MSTATIGVTAGVDSAMRRGFSEASVRLQPEAKISEIITALGTLGVTAAVEDGLLILRQDTTELHTHKALRSFAARPEFAKFFVLSSDDPKTWTVAEKTKFIRQFGADAYGKRCAAPVLEAGIRTLDPNMSRTEYLKLTTRERIAFIREFGDDAVRKVMQKLK